ncbi:hypothetical protein PMI15_00342 [Polaromonas sp. CF318]|uniref:hypothetical protein n=1 Tax=Polaromonas sp. CF318 TaxID=1144318 RepID=UPI0002711EA3|nr:hypothetical protein [Polaromonas sp. CF318]EJL90395.1 hypothetical protein PMI15_00342 [Polaromonas sp. CF318]
MDDIPALLALERRQWTAEQAAGPAEFRERIEAHPDLCGGAFCARTGELLGSVFAKPTHDAEWTDPGNWAQSASLDAQPAGKLPQQKRTRCMFGISLTSVEPGAAVQLLAFYYLYLLKRGYTEIFLGSPMPGLKRHLQRHPGACVEAYARATRSGLPVDPQLRYYHGKGWREIVAVRENYFPHEDSCDYGAILKAKVPLRHLALLFKLVPVSALRMISALAPRLAIPAGR